MRVARFFILSPTEDCFLSRVLCHNFQALVYAEFLREAIPFVLPYLSLYSSMLFVYGGYVQETSER
jgi:hypothetical protein